MKQPPDGSNSIQHVRRLDPFSYLPPEMFRLINDLLDPPETELLRKVCKSWKRLSESFNTHKAIVRHCPTVYVSLPSDPRIANIWFRRWICYEQNIREGLAQSIDRSSETTMWNIRNHTLVSGHWSGRLMVQQLRPSWRSRDLVKHKLILKEIFRSLLSTEFTLRKISLTAGGDVVTALETWEKGYVAQITKFGRVIWFVETEWSAVTVGVEEAYILKILDDIRHVGTFFELEKIDLSSGVRRKTSTRFSTIRNRRPSGSLDTLEMVLSADKSFIAIKCKNMLYCIFDLSKNELVDIVESGWLDYGPSETSWMYSEPTSSGFVEVCWKRGMFDTAYTYTYDKASRTFCRALFKDYRYFGWLSRVGIDVQRDLEFGYRGKREASRLTVKSFETLQQAKSKSRFLSVPIGSAKQREMLTLDLKERRKGLQREIHQPMNRASDFFGMYNGYLVFHHVKTQQLIVADFWPLW